MSKYIRHLIVAAATSTVVLSARISDANAPSGHYTSPLAGTVYDTKSKLTWQQSVQTTLYTQSGAAMYCASLGSGWRLPTVKELVSIVDFSQTTAPLIDRSWFPGTAATDAYWTLTFVAGSSQNYAWIVSVYNGMTQTGLVTSKNYNVRCVH
jgi:hypothetical protein